MSDTYDGPRPVPDLPMPDDDTAVRLLRLAGPRPPVPAADAAIVKEAARAEWRRLVWAEKRRRRYVRGGWGLMAAAALLLIAVRTGVWQSWTRALGDPVATVATVSGDAGDLEPGAELRTGTVVETSAAGAPGKAALRLADGGASLRVDAGSALRLLSAREIELQRGALYVDTGGAALEVRTALGTVTNVGTRFELRLRPDGGALRVRVRDGAVRVDGVGEPVGERTQITLRADGSVDGPQEILPYGPEWDWIADVRPPMDVEGPTVLQVLEWAAAESGLELHLEGIDRALLESDLGGSVGFGTLEQQVAAALMAACLDCLRHRFLDGELRIEPKTPEAP